MEKSDLLMRWLSNKWLCYGVGPVVAANAGYLVSVLIFERAVRMEMFKDSLITYGKNTKTDRLEENDKTRMKVLGFWEQLKISMKVLAGPNAWVSSLFSAFLMEKIMPKITSKYPTLADFIKHMILLELVGDFFLYWGHRIQHEIPYLWENFHSYHHQLESPTAVSAVCIDEIDATLQGSLPIVLAAAVVRPHPITYYAYSFARLAENVVNHTGINNFYINLLFMKVLPFRASVNHHDSHHKFSKYGPRAKNYAEFFTIWDKLFGTYKNPK